MEAAFGHDLVRLRRALEEGADLDAPDRAYGTPLGVAAELGFTAAVKALLEAGADPNLRDSRGRLPLLRAAALPSWTPDEENSECVRRLLEAGASVHSSGVEALLGAAFLGRRQVAALLVEAGVPIDSRDWDGHTALIMAARSGSIELVRDLLGRGARAIDRDCGGLTALDWAARLHDNPELTELLIDAGSTLESPFPEDVPPLTAAARAGHARVIRILLRRGADPRRCHPGMGTALDVLLRERPPGWERAARLLRSALLPVERKRAGRAQRRPAPERDP